MSDFRFLIPTYTQLTVSQKIAVDSTNPILVSGGPGSGKTVVSVHRLKKLLSQNEKVRLFTFNRTLMAAIRGLARSENFSADVVDSFYSWYYANTKGFLDDSTTTDISQRLVTYTNENGGKYAEIIFDEAQDFSPHILASLNALADKVSCGADRNQDIRNNYDDDAEERILEILNFNQTLRDYVLSSNFRNTKQTFAFARAFVPNNPGPYQINLDLFNVGEKPELYDSLNEHDQLEKIVEVVKAFQLGSNIGILVHKKEQVDTIRHYLTRYSLSHSYYYNKMDRSAQFSMERSLQSPLITTFASCKGLEFDYVVMPFFEYSTEALMSPLTNRNHYYVAATRARKQLYVFCNGLPSLFNHGNFSDTYSLNGEDDEYHELPF